MAGSSSQLADGSTDSVMAWETTGNETLGSSTDGSFSSGECYQSPWLGLVDPSSCLEGVMPMSSDTRRTVTSPLRIFLEPRAEDADGKATVDTVTNHYLTLKHPPAKRGIAAIPPTHRSLLGSYLPNRRHRSSLT